MHSLSSASTRSVADGAVCRSRGGTGPMPAAGGAGARRVAAASAPLPSVRGASAGPGSGRVAMPERLGELKAVAITDSGCLGEAGLDATGKGHGRGQQGEQLRVTFTKRGGERLGA